jgi:hypothetical protein
MSLMDALKGIVDNPITHAIGHAAGSLWNMTDLAQNLKNQALQRAQLQQQMKMRDFDMQQQQYGNLTGALDAGGRLLAPGETAGQSLPTPRDPTKPVWETQLPNVENPANVFTLPGTNQRVYYPSQQEQNDITVRQKVGLTEALNAANDMEAPAGSEEAGVAPGTKIPRNAYDQLVGRIASAKEAAAARKAAAQTAADAKKNRPDATQMIPGYVGAGGGPLIYDKNTQTSSEVKIPPGAKRAPSANQDEITQRSKERQQDRADTRSQAEADRQLKLQQAMQERHDKAYEAEQNLWQLGQAYVDASNSTDDRVIDPRTGREVDNTPEARKAWAALANDSKAKAMQKQQESKEIRKRMGWGEFGQAKGAADAKAKPVNPATPQTAAPAQKPVAQTAQAAQIAPGAQGAQPTNNPAKPKYKEGQTATGPGGKKVVFKGGKWQPLP